MRKIFFIQDLKMHKIINLFKGKTKISNKKDSIPNTQTSNDYTKLLYQLQDISGYQRLFLLGLFPGKNIKEISKNIFKAYPKASGFLEQVQQCNLHLLKDFKKICDQCNIKFWLHAGTLIGALRNDGFIPWDDDVDIAMTRNDFLFIREKLMNNNELAIYEYYNELTCSRQYQLKYKNGLPVFIDIVIYDICDAVTPKEQESFWIKYRREYANMLQKFKTKLGNPPIIEVGYYKVGLYQGNTKKAVDELINVALKNTIVEKTLSFPSFFYSIENYPFSYPIMKYQDLYPLKLVKFEDSEFYIPANSELYLYGYGNIWLPPQDIGAHPHIYAFEKYKKEIQLFLEKKNA